MYVCIYVEDKQRGTTDISLNQTMSDQILGTQENLYASPGYWLYPPWWSYNVMVEIKIVKIFLLMPIGDQPANLIPLTGS